MGADDVKKVTVERIKAAVAKECDVTISDLEGRCRTARFLKPRTIAMALSYEYRPISLTWIGYKFGNRDHSLVVHARHQLKRYCDKDPEFAALVERCHALIKSKVPIRVTRDVGACVSKPKPLAETLELRVRDAWRASLGLRSSEDRYAPEWAVL